VGIGYDAHRLVTGRPLVLAGVTVPHELGLAGHSDADVVTHALIDALLGAGGLPDIGALFPDTNAAYAGADSVGLLSEVVARLAAAGWRVGNADVVVICEAPKLASYREAMRARLASALGVAANAVGVKATTTEGMGFTGQGEGIAAQAVCLLERA
jgi:2-C-methyl-D-erythritol 2,4-cyclodiphosphate synthase